MGVIAEGILRGCQGLFTPVSLGYPLSVFNKNSTLKRSVAQGWGPGTRERQHAYRDTIPERWGERAHPRTQAQLSLNRSALICEHMQKKYPDVCITYIRVEICTLMLAKGSVNIFLSM